jgi:hypothetical protein
MADQLGLLDYRPRPALSGLLAHELWPSLRPHLRVEHLGKHRRLELASTCPADLRGLALQVVVPCAACGASINPLSRRAPSGRGEDVGHVYLSVACPLEVRIGCSRGRAAKVATDAIARALEAANDNPGGTK